MVALFTLRCRILLTQIFTCDINKLVPHSMNSSISNDHYCCVRQFNFHLQESCCANFSKKKTLIGYNTLVCTPHITHIHAASAPILFRCAPTMPRNVVHFSAPFSIHQHLVIRIANFMLRGKASHFYLHEVHAPFSSSFFSFPSSRIFFSSFCTRHTFVRLFRIFLVYAMPFHMP